MYVVPEPTAFPSGGPNVTHDLGPARRIDLAAPSNFGGQIDSESLMVDPVGDLYLVRKNFKSPLTVFRARAEALRGAGAADTVWMEDFFTPSRSGEPPDRRPAVRPAQRGRGAQSDAAPPPAVGRSDAVVGELDVGRHLAQRAGDAGEGTLVQRSGVRRLRAQRTDPSAPRRTTITFTIIGGTR